MHLKKILKYTVGFTIPICAALAISFGGIWVFLTPFYAFFFLAALEMLMPLSKKNMSEIEEEVNKKDPVYDWMLYLNVPVQFGLLFYFLYTISHQQLYWWELSGLILSMGICCGVIGINVAHELGHRKSIFERFLAKSLLLTSLYMHFIIEHNKGHHKKVGTEHDPSSALLNENIYAFYFRTIFGSIKSAREIQKSELQADAKKTISFSNELLLFFIIELFFIIITAILFEWQTAIFFIIASIIGILLLESVNYIEHYGLRRKIAPSGNYERVQPWHSWNSDHMVGRLVLYELTRHSDHHYLSSRKYQILRRLEEAPQLPAGYPAMILLSLVPPLFFKVMNPRVEKVMATHI